MDLLEKKEYYINLFDFYESLFTEKQRRCFREYYFQDLSLGEIAEAYGEQDRHLRPPSENRVPVGSLRRKAETIP